MLYPKVFFKKFIFYGHKYDLFIIVIAWNLNFFMKDMNRNFLLNNMNYTTLQKLWNMYAWYIIKLFMQKIIAFIMTQQFCVKKWVESLKKYKILKMYAVNKDMR